MTVTRNGKITEEKKGTRNDKITKALNKKRTKRTKEKKKWRVEILRRV